MEEIRFARVGMHEDRFEYGLIATCRILSYIIIVQAIMETPKTLCGNYFPLTRDAYLMASMFGGRVSLCFPSEVIQSPL